jgi:hypothetical protein
MAALLITILAIFQPAALLEWLLAIVTERLVLHGDNHFDIQRGGEVKHPKNRLQGSENAIYHNLGLLPNSLNS